MLYVAAANAEHHHHGRVYAIEMGIKGIPLIRQLAPSQDILDKFRGDRGYTDWTKFERAYRVELQSTASDRSLTWLLREALTCDLTLVTKPTEGLHNHRYTIAKAIEDRQSRSYGGLDIPIDEIGKLEQKAIELGLPIQVSRLKTSTMVIYRLWRDCSCIGEYTETGIKAALGNEINPTALKWRNTLAKEGIR